MSHFFVLPILLSILGAFPGFDDRPNILIVVADDMGTDSWAQLGIGTELPSTPNLDELAREGITFARAWAQPLCSPTRASVLSGLHPTKNGVNAVGAELDLSFETIFEAVDRVTAGAYARGVVGKWHISRILNATHPNDQGADHYVGRLGGGFDYLNWDRTENGSTTASTEYVTTHYTDEAIRWVSNQSKPWMLWLAHEAPHSPFHEPPDSLFTRSEILNNQDRYLAMIESVDHEIGRLLDSLDPSERDNTFIVFIGDNGTPGSVLQTYPARRGKGTLYEGGVRVPMIVAGAGVARTGAVDTSLVHVLDLYATVLEVVGEELGGGVGNSFSLFPRLRDAHAATRPFNLSENLGEVAIRDRRHKLIETSEGARQLFDLWEDPFELSDLLEHDPTVEEVDKADALSAEARLQLDGWSCADGILNGDETIGSCSTATSSDVQPERSVFDVGAPYPNPTLGTISVTAQSNDPLAIFRMSVFDVLGKRVASIEGTESNSILVWDGLDKFGHPVGPGVYVARIGSAHRFESRVFTVVR